MNRKHWLVRCGAILLVLAMLTLSACGSKPAAPAETSATTAPTAAPTESTEAAASAAPTESTEPAETVVASETAAPTEAVESTETVTSTESAKPTETVTATVTVKPTETVKPTATTSTIAKPTAANPTAATTKATATPTKATAASTKATAATKPAETAAAVVTTKPAETKATSAPTTPAATVAPTVAATSKRVKNVIFMIADGGGYDNFTLANKVKQTMQAQGINTLSGAKTQITSDSLAGLGKNNVSGLYLNELLVGSANTLLTVNHGYIADYKSYITDSAAAGTALATGYKTQYTFLGLDEKEKPKASITELARMNGMATGLVTTKSYMDATPQAFFTTHSIYRYEYQDNSIQSLLSGIDVVIGEGTEFGDLYKEYPTSHPDLYASAVGYTVARSKTELLAMANSSTTQKLWAAILGAGKTTENDRAGDHISYDIDAADSAEQPSLLDMTQAALQVLGSNINDPDGFFLMIEGGAVDNAAESGNLRAAVGEYLAFDEAFGYCVQWAAERGDTIVIAVPDHDSGGFSGIEACQQAIIDSIITGKLGSEAITSATTFAQYKTLLTNAGEDTSEMTLFGEHTDMAVPISLYAPESVRNDLLTAMGLPTAAGQIRTGDNEYYAANESGDFTWYSSSALNNDYTIDNTKIAPALTQVLNLGSLDSATATLFVPVGKYNGTTFTAAYGGELIFAETTHENYYAKYNCNTYVNGGLSISRNATTYTLNGVTKEIPTIGNVVPKALFVLDTKEQGTKGTFYVPYSVLVDAGLK